MECSLGLLCSGGFRKPAEFAISTLEAASVQDPSSTPASEVGDPSALGSAEDPAARAAADGGDEARMKAQIKPEADNVAINAALRNAVYGFVNVHLAACEASVSSLNDADPGVMDQWAEGLEDLQAHEEDDLPSEEIQKGIRLSEPVEPNVDLVICACCYAQRKRLATACNSCGSMRAPTLSRGSAELRARV